MTAPVAPPPGTKGKWIVLILVPVIFISFIWLAYARLNFVHPTNLPTKAESTLPR